jgi:hypothetical protein
MQTEVQQFTEHVMPGAGSYAMFDCEMYLSHFQGRLDREQLEGLVARFPGDMLLRLAKERVIGPRAPVWVVVKGKSRTVAGKGTAVDFKCSNHFLTSLWAYSEMHSEAVHAGIEGLAEWMKACKEYLDENKHLGCIRDFDSAEPISLLSMDKSALPGGKTGFQTLLSRKKGADERPCLIKTILYVNGQQSWEEYDFPPGPHEPGANLSSREMGLLLFDSLYTVPKVGMQFYNKREEWLKPVSSLFYLLFKNILLPGVRAPSSQPVLIQNDLGGVGGCWGRRFSSRCPGSPFQHLPDQAGHPRGIQPTICQSGFSQLWLHSRSQPPLALKSGESTSLKS